MTTPTAEKFNYQDLPDAAATELRAIATRINVHAQLATDAIWQIGKDLIAARASLSADDTFTAWVSSECNLSRSSAYRFMSVAERFAEGVPSLGRLSPSVVFELAAPSTPEEVIDTVEEKTARGEKVTAAEVKAMKADLRNSEEARNEAEEERDEAPEDLRLSEEQRRNLDSQIYGLQEELEKASEPQVIDGRPPEPDDSNLKLLLLNVWRLIPQEVRDWFFEQVPNSRVVPGTGGEKVDLLSPPRPRTDTPETETGGAIDQDANDESTPPADVQPASEGSSAEQGERPTVPKGLRRSKRDDESVELAGPDSPRPQGTAR